jgi:hypothetical protein
MPDGYGAHSDDIVRVDEEAPDQPASRTGNTRPLMP